LERVGPVARLGERKSAGYQNFTQKCVGRKEQKVGKGEGMAASAGNLFLKKASP